LYPRRAVLLRLQHGKLLEPLAEPSGYRVEHGGPLLRRGPAPLTVLVRGLRRRYRPVGVLETSLGHPGNHVLGGRAADLESVVAFDPIAADEHGIVPDGLHPAPFPGVTTTLSRDCAPVNVLAARGRAVSSDYRHNGCAAVPTLGDRLDTGDRRPVRMPAAE
jgi:hypothetical protein